jgi:hypothetical protein
MSIEQEKSVIKELLTEKHLEKLLEEDKVDWKKAERFVHVLHERLWKHSLNIAISEDLIRDSQKIDYLREKWIKEMAELERFTYWLQEYSMPFDNMAITHVIALINSIGKKIDSLDDRRLVLDQLRISQNTLTATRLMLIIALIALFLSLIAILGQFPIEIEW